MLGSRTNHAPPAALRFASWVAIAIAYAGLVVTQERPLMVTWTLGFLGVSLGLRAAESSLRFREEVLKGLDTLDARTPESA